MRDYRIYVIGDDDHIAGMPEVISYVSDEEVVQSAAQRLNGHDLEIWQGSRKVKRLPSVDSQRCARLSRGALDYQLKSPLLKSRRSSFLGCSVICDSL